MATEDEINANISGDLIPGGNIEAAKAIEQKLLTKLNNYEQLEPKEVVKLKGLLKNSGWGTGKHYDKDRKEEVASAIGHYNKHKGKGDMDVKSLAEYNQKLSDTIRSGDTVIELVNKEKYGLQVFCYNPKTNYIAVFSPGKEEIGTFHSLNGNYDAYLNKQTIKRMKLMIKGINKWRISIKNYLNI